MELPKDDSGLLFEDCEPATLFREFAAECIELAQTNPSPEKHDPMDPNHLGCFRIGRVRIIDNQGETFSAIGNTLPRKWRRDIFGLAGVLRGNVTILLERR